MSALSFEKSAELLCTCRRNWFYSLRSDSAREGRSCRSCFKIFKKCSFSTYALKVHMGMGLPFEQFTPRGEGFP